MSRIQFKKFLNLLSEANSGRLANIRSIQNKSVKNATLQVFPTYQRVNEVAGINAADIRHFMFSNYEEVESGFDETEFRLNLPFDTVFFEALERPLLVKNYRVQEDELEHPTKGKISGGYLIEVHYRVETTGVLIHELDVDTYYLVGLDNWYYESLHDPIGDKNLKSIFENDFKSVLSKSITYEGVLRRADLKLDSNQRQLRPELDLHRSLVWMCESLRSKSFVTANLDTRETVRVGSGVNRKKIRLDNVILVINQKQKAAVAERLSGWGKIDWSHRFEVRGHWRKHEGVGKDRNGQRNVEGYTWVSDHIRGPDDKPLIRKTRIVDTRSDDQDDGGSQSA